MGERALSVQALITQAYSASVSIMWEFEGLTEKNQRRIRKYCPECKKFDTLMPAKPGPDDNPDLKYRCRSCGYMCKYPATLKSRGETVKSSRVGRTSYDNRLVAAIEHSKVMGAVESQSDEIRDWLLWMYTDPGAAERDRLESNVMSTLVERLDTVERDALRGLKDYGSAFQLMHVQMLDFRNDRRQERAGSSRPAFYATVIGRDRSQFDEKRLWGRFMRAVFNEMKEMDGESLTRVEEFMCSSNRDD